MDDINNMIIKMGKHFLIFAVVMIAGVVVAKILLLLIQKLLMKSNVEHTAKTFLSSFLKVLFYAVVVVSALGSAGVNITSLITALGAAALTAGLALQDTLKNLVSGLIILMNKPFTAGDIIEFEGIEGYVDSIRIFYTRLHTFDNKAVQIPNSRLTANNVINCSANGNRRVELKFTISFEDNLTKVKSVIYDVISQNELILTEPEPKVLVSGHLENGTEILILVWVNHSDYYTILYDMEEKVKLAFDENNITIPYPHVQLKE